jgi:hypothetical protein
MESFKSDGPSDSNTGAAGLRRVEFAPVDAGAFIGRWSEATSSFESLRPKVARPVVVAPPAPPTLSSVLCDIVIAVSALLMIFCIPGLIIYAAMGR